LAWGRAELCGAVAEVSRDEAAQAQLDQITGNQPGHIDLDWVAVAYDDGPVADLRVQRLGGLLRPVLVGEAQLDRCGEDDADDQRVGALADE
jgi:hypothetical protein